MVREEQGDHWVEYTFDALGQRTHIRSSLGADIRFTHTVMGNTDQMTAGRWQARFDYDLRGLELQRRLSGGVQMNWRRDGQGRPTYQEVTTSTQARQRVHHWKYQDLLAQLEDSITGVSQYGYDAFNTLTHAQYEDVGEELRLPDAVGNLYERADQADRQYGPGGGC